MPWASSIGFYTIDPNTVKTYKNLYEALYPTVLLGQHHLDYPPCLAILPEEPAIAQLLLAARYGRYSLLCWYAFGHFEATFILCR